MSSVHSSSDLASTPSSSGEEEPPHRVANDQALRTSMSKLEKSLESYELMNDRLKGKDYRQAQKRESTNEIVEIQEFSF